MSSRLVTSFKIELSK